MHVLRCISCQNAVGTKIKSYSAFNFRRIMYGSLWAISLREVFNIILLIYHQDTVLRRPDFINFFVPNFTQMSFILINIYYLLYLYIIPNI